jgi:hypothetical protein
MSTCHQADPSVDGRTSLRRYLAAQRDCVLAIVDGLGEDAMLGAYCRCGGPWPALASAPDDRVPPAAGHLCGVSRWRA